MKLAHRSLSELAIYNCKHDRNEDRRADRRRDMSTAHETNSHMHMHGWVHNQSAAACAAIHESNAAHDTGRVPDILSDLTFQNP